MTARPRLRAAVAGLTILASAPMLAPRPASGGDAPPEPRPRAFVECVLVREDVFVHEAVAVRLRVGWDAAYFREHAIPLFVRDLDLPVDVHAPWVRAIAGARDFASAADGTSPRDPRVPGVRFALDGAEAIGVPQPDVVVDGRPLRVVEVVRRVEFLQPGDVPLEAPVLRFATTSRFDDDLATGRAAVDRRDEGVRGASRTLRVRPLPETARPAEFVDAVGRFTVGADVDRREVDVGGTVRVTLTLDGDGNLETLTAPRIDASGEARGLHVLGSTDDHGATRRTISFDVAVGDMAAQIPSVSLAFFDPRAAAYRVARADAIALVVRAARSGPAPVATSRDAPGGPARGDERPAGSAVPVGSVVAVALAALLAVALAIGLAARGARRRREAGDRDAEARAALATLRARVGRSPDVEAGALLVDFLATRLGVPTAAVGGPELPRTLEAAGVPAALAARAAAVVERGVAARYGGAEGPTLDDVLALASDVDAALRAPASDRSPSP